MVIWITGLSGAGKTTVAQELYNVLKGKYPNTVFLDGDILRGVLDSGGYTYGERYALAKKNHNLCKMLEKQGINVICATMSLFHEIQQLNRVDLEEYCEVFIDVDLEKLIKRDKNGLYSGALQGRIKNVVGVDIEAEYPLTPHIRINNNECNNLAVKVKKIIDFINMK